MSEPGPVSDCDDCGRSVPLFAPTCPDCGTGLSWSSEVPCDVCGTRVDHREECCPDCGAALSEWRAVVARVLDHGFHVDVPVSDRIPDPESAGFERGRGKPVGQRADYRLPLDDGSEIHVREYADRYEVHRDRRSAQDRVGHLTRDAPLETAVGVASLFLLARLSRRVTPLERLAALGPSRDRLSTLGPAELVGRVPTPSLTGVPTSGVGGLRGRRSE